MALYIDSAFLDDIIVATHTLPLAGVTTNPSILLAAREMGQDLSPQELLTQLLTIMHGDIFMQPSITDEERAYEDTLHYISANPERVVPKIPMTRTGLRLAQRLKTQGHRIAFTAVTTVAQAYIAAQTGADFVIPYYNRLQRTGIDASARINQMATVFARQNLPTRILVASLKTPDEVAQALSSGAHDLTIPPNVLQDMVTAPESEQAVIRFEQDWQKMNNL